MAEIVQQFLNVIVLASIYCLIAAGLSIVYGVMRIPNFAQGNIYMLGAYLFCLFSGLPALSGSFLVISALSLFTIGLLGIAIDLFCFRPLKDKPHVNLFIVAIGLMMFLEGFVIVVFGPDYKEVPPIWAHTFNFGEVTITFQRLLVVVTSAVALIAVHLFIKRTKTGAMLEAMSQDYDLAIITGINANRMSLVAFMISAALAGVAGIIISPVSCVYPYMGGMPLLIAFAAVIFGGMGSLAGAVLGACIMAAVQVWTTRYFSEMVGNIAIFGIMILILLFKPEGLMGGKK